MPPQDKNEAHEEDTYTPEVLEFERFIVDERNENAQQLANQVKELQYHEIAKESGEEEVFKMINNRRVAVPIDWNIEMIKKNIGHYQKYVKACDKILSGEVSVQEYLDESIEWDEDMIEKLKETMNPQYKAAKEKRRQAKKKKEMQEDAVKSPIQTPKKEDDQDDSSDDSDEN